MNLESLLLLKAGGITSRKIAWSKAFDHLSQARLSEDDVVFFAEKMDSPSSLIALSQSLEEQPAAARSPRLALMAFADDSLYPATQWIEALEILLSHLRQCSRKATYSKLLGYILCSAEFGRDKADSSPLPKIVMQMIDDYGFEGD